MGAIVTGLIGNYIALSRLLGTLADDGMLPGWMGTKDRNQAPRNAILCILGISVILPFLGRTAISWIVDVTTVGATIACVRLENSPRREQPESENPRPDRNDYCHDGQCV